MLPPESGCPSPLGFSTIAMPQPPWHGMICQHRCQGRGCANDGLAGAGCGSIILCGCIKRRSFRAYYVHSDYVGFLFLHLNDSSPLFCHSQIRILPASSRIFFTVLADNRKNLSTMGSLIMFALFLKATSDEYRK